MKTKNILIILLVVAITFIFSDATVPLTPLIIGVITLNEFRKNDIAKYIGFFSLKPVFMMFYSMFIANYGFLQPLYYNYPIEIISAIFWFIPEFILTLVIVYSFRQLFGNNRLTWLFLIGDTIRWVGIVTLSLIPVSSTNSLTNLYLYTPLYIYVPLYILSFFLSGIFPSLYAIVGYFSVKENILSESIVHESPTNLTH